MVAKGYKAVRPPLVMKLSLIQGRELAAWWLEHKYSEKDMHYVSSLSRSQYLERRMLQGDEYCRVTRSCLETGRPDHERYALYPQIASA